MRVALLYNRDAGEGVSLSQVRETLERHGHTIVRVVENDADSGRLLDEPVDLVVAAGGDGTVSTAARFLVGRGMPLAILPLGTANNIACSLGINGSIQQASFNWSLARRQPLDVGVASGPWGVSRFLEASDGASGARGRRDISRGPGQSSDGTTCPHQSSGLPPP
jgi:diacylglycerol kinase (ATP)